MNKRRSNEKQTLSLFSVNTQRDETLQCEDNVQQTTKCTIHHEMQNELRNAQYITKTNYEMHNELRNAQYITKTADK